MLFFTKAPCPHFLSPSLSLSPRYCFPDTDEEQAVVDALRLDALLNLASCKLRTAQYDEVVDFCSQALVLDGTNVKALYRRAQAHRLRDDFKLALADIGAAIRAKPSMRALWAELDTIRARAACYRSRSRTMYQSMVGGGAKVPATGAAPSDVLPDVGVLRRLRNPDEFKPT